MKGIPYLFAILFFTGIGQILRAQRPGGVKGALSWYLTVTDKTGENQWVNKASGQVMLTAAGAGSDRSINYNPVWQLHREASGLTLPLPAANLSQLHIFSVQQIEEQTGETHLWSLEKNGRTEQVMTDRRVASLSAFQYMNFTPPAPARPALSTYLQHEAHKTESITRQTLRLGGYPKRKDLPVLPFQGLVAELILFDRQLAPEEQSRIESYLAVKYGLTLRDPKPVNYLRSDGLPIWHGRNNPNFHHAVAGIGRDDASGLYQRQSTSSEEPELLTIAWTSIDQTSKAVPDGTFLMWGHNDQPLSMQQTFPGQPEMLERQWHLQPDGQSGEQHTTLSFDRKSIRTRLAPGEQFWLIIDRSASGNFPQGQVQYYPAAKLENGRIYFENIAWDTDGSGADRFTLGKGPALFGPFWIEAPTCNPPTPGRLTVTAAGGVPTYFITLRSQTDGKIRTASPQEHVWTFSDLETGDYTLLIRDAQGQRYEAQLYIESSDSPQPSVAGHYLLSPGQPLTLDASIPGEQLAVQYSWSGPDQFRSREAVVDIRQAGSYQLEINRNGCISRRLITVENAGASDLQGLELFPNPTSGPFTLTFELPRATPSTISVFNEAGQLIDQFHQDAGQVHYYSEVLQPAGVYFLQIDAGNVSRTIRLLVVE